MKLRSIPTVQLHISAPVNRINIDREPVQPDTQDTKMRLPPITPTNKRPPVVIASQDPLHYDHPRRRTDSSAFNTATNSAPVLVSWSLPSHDCIYFPIYETDGIHPKHITSGRMNQPDRWPSGQLYWQPAIYTD